MKRKTQGAESASPKRRTTLTIPADALAQAKRIARARHSSLSAVISETLSEGLRRHAEAERSAKIVALYSRAFGGFNEEELLLLDGVILDPASR